MVSNNLEIICENEVSSQQNITVWILIDCIATYFVLWNNLTLLVLFFLDVSGEKNVNFQFTIWTIQFNSNCIIKGRYPVAVYEEYWDCSDAIVDSYECGEFLH